jgi:hypothetical protein
MAAAARALGAPGWGDCRQCHVSEDEAEVQKVKKQRGCDGHISATPKFKIKCICAGSGCGHCKDDDGLISSEYTGYECPIYLSRDMWYIMPHFNAYRASNYIVWPNSKTRLYQPAPLIKAFDYLVVALAPKEENDNGK